MRKSDQFLFFTTFIGVVFVLLLLSGYSGQAAANAERRERARLARELMLTDLCLFTEARYTRHPSMTDLHSAFQDHPLSLEHFPSGSFISLPARYQR